MSALVEFSMFPTDKGESVSEHVSKVIKMISESGVQYKLTPMGTIIETDTLAEALHILQLSYNELEPVANRVFCTAKFDIRKGKNDRMKGKIESIEKKIGKVNC